MDFIEVSEDVIHVDRLTSKVTSPTCGAISVFLGMYSLKFGNS